MQSWMARVNRITSILKQTVPPCVTTLSREMELFVGSEHSRLYQKHRPAYPSSLYQFIADFCKTGTGSLDSAVDVGCGTGLSTRPLCEHFCHVIGVDVSETQIKMAREAHAQTNLSFEVSEAERLTFMHDASTDLVTVAQAIHWIDQEPFYKEVERILKPGGSLIVYGYGNCVLDNDKGNQVIQRFYRHDLHGYWDSRRRHIDNLCQEVRLPFPGRTRNSDFVIQYRWTAAEVVGYLSTWSAWQSYLKQNPESHLLRDIEQHLRDIYLDQRVAITWPVFLLLGRKAPTS